MKTLQELQPLILEWANDKNLLNRSIAPKQKLKLLEEVGEIARAILHNNIPEIKDGIGDVFVVLTILAKQTDSIYSCEFNGSYDSFESEYDFLKFISFVCISVIDEFQVLNGLCVRLNLDLTECANIAWNEIKNREGKTIEGVFIKNQ